MYCSSSWISCASGTSCCASLRKTARRNSPSRDDHRFRRVGIAMDERGDRVERVEQEVGLELSLQRFELCLDR